MTIRPARAEEGPMVVDMLRRSFATVAKRFGLTTENGRGVPLRDRRVGMVRKESQ